MNDINLYNESTDRYEEFQHSRPDYNGAIAKVIEMATIFLKGNDKATISDFCCGTGSISKSIAEKHEGVAKLNLIDINKDFLNIASGSGIQTDNLNIMHTNALEADVESEADIVLCIFAYHHMSSSDKDLYIKKLKRSLKTDGVILVAEIYSPDKETTLKYYDYLYSVIPDNKKSSELKKFIQETANSDTFEFKVSRKFAHDQFKQNGLNMVKSEKIFPTDNTFTPNVGTFVEMWK